MSDPKEDGNQEELEWLLFELDEAREDQRVSLDHIVQVLVACIAALAILYSVAAGFGGDENTIPWKNEGIATIAACVILVAGFYGSSIGQERMFRYHYMEMIEKRISEIVPTGDENIALGWNQFSSRLITANIHHLTNRVRVGTMCILHLRSYRLLSDAFCFLCYCCLPCIINGSGFYCRWLLCPLLYIFCTAIS